MKNKITRILCVLLALTLLFSVTGCGGTEDVWSEWIETVEVPDDTADSSQEETSSDDTSASTEEQTDSSEESTGGKVSSDNKTNVSSQNKTPTKNQVNITVGGKSKYKIVVSLSNEGYDQGRLFQKVIKATSDASVPLILDTETSDGPEIVIGNTKRKQSQELMKKLKENEYAIKCYSDGSIFIVGSNAYALEMAADRFLKDYFGYDKNATKAGKEKVVPIKLDIHQSILDDYKLVWNDEFEGTKVDTNKWCFKPLMAAQEHLKLYHDERAVQQKNGYMNLIAGRIDDENYWTNTALTTADTMVFKYGYVEMRAKVPFGKPAFPSFWMQSSMYEAADPYVMAEVDMFEHFAQHGDDYLQTGCHKWYRDGSGEHYVGPQIGSYRFGSEKEAEKWHTYSMLWTPNTLYFMVDGKTYHTIDITDKGDFGERGDGMGSFHDYAHLIFNNYLNTNKGGTTDNNEFNATPDDKFPITYTIDYVRIYQLPGQGGILNVKDMVN